MQDDRRHRDAQRTPDARHSLWTWKVEDREANTDLRLRYEPGNWGDVLKGSWAVTVARHLARRRAEHSSDTPPLRYLDPWCGAETYPLTPGADARLELPESGVYREAQGTRRAAGRLASTARLVLDTWNEAGQSLEAQLFDADAVRLATWAGVESVSALHHECGRDALGGEPGDLLLVDPYDFFVSGSSLIDPLERRAQTEAVLVYLYNKAPRGGGQLRHYEALRRQLSPHRTLVGRVPADAILPRAWHEVWLLAPEVTITACRSALEKLTRRIACKLSQGGCFEAPDGPDGHQR